MPRRNWDSTNAVIDIGIIVIAHVDNPAKEEALDFLKDVLLGNINALIPTSVFLGSYHILTRYLKIPRLEAKNALIQTLEVAGEVIYEDILTDHVINALDYASVYKIESWDGYLISLVKDLGGNIIFSIDNGLKSIPGVSVINPISDNAMKKYHQWIKELSKK